MNLIADVVHLPRLILRRQKGASVLGVRLLQVQTCLIHAIVSFEPANLADLVVDTELLAASEWHDPDGLGILSVHSDVHLGQRSAALCELRLAKLGYQLFELRVRSRSVEDLSLAMSRMSGKRTGCHQPLCTALPLPLLRPCLPLCAKRKEIKNTSQLAGAYPPTHQSEHFVRQIQARLGAFLFAVDWQKVVQIGFLIQANSLAGALRIIAPLSV